MKKKKRKAPKFVVITKAYSSLSWFNSYIGQTFEVLEVSEYESVRICYEPEMERYGWVPLECCEPHLKAVK